MRLDAFLDSLEQNCQALEAQPELLREHAELCRRHGAKPEELTLRDFVRVRTMFECFRSGGWARVAWRITNQKPNSVQIWRQWRAKSTADLLNPKRASAVAECDELSALLAFIVYRLNVRGVGLFWPVWNHVVAVWVLRPKQPRAQQLRIVLPTSQVMLPEQSGIGDRDFDAYTQRRIWEYRRADQSKDDLLPGEFADFILAEISRHGHKPRAQLARERRERFHNLSV